MEDTTVKICRLCLKIVCKDEYEIVEEKLIVIKTIFLDLDWTISENPVMCCECTETLQKSYIFKSTCLNTEKRIKAFSKDEQDEIDLWQMRNEGAGDEGSQEEKRICRFCMELKENNTCFNLEEKIEISIMLQKCLPEVDLFLVCEPVICRNCFDDLENLFSFVTRCLDVEKSINIYRDTEGNNSSDKVNLYNVLQFTKIKKESNNDDEHKEEFVAENNFEKVFIKSENSHKTEDFDMNHEVFIKSEPREFEEESKHSVQTEDIEDKPKNQVFRRKKRPRKELTKTFSCSQCDFTTKYKRNLRLHIMVIHNKPQAQCQKCDQCNYRTFYPTRLTAHLRLHTKELPYTCEVCQEKYNHRRYLDSHIVTKHPESKQEVVTKLHICKLCNFKTVYSIFLTRHVLTVHEDKDVKTFKCDKCAYSTDKRSDLRRHVFTHTDTKPFVCPECPKSFTTKTHLDSHILNKHNDNEEALKLITSKIHYCKLCEFKVVNPTNLTTHMKGRHKNKV